MRKSGAEGRNFSGSGAGPVATHEAAYSQEKQGWVQRQTGEPNRGTFSKDGANKSRIGDIGVGADISNEKPFQKRSGETPSRVEKPAEDFKSQRKSVYTGAKMQVTDSSKSDGCWKRYHCSWIMGVLLILLVIGGITGGLVYYFRFRNKQPTGLLYINDAFQPKDVISNDVYQTIASIKDSLNHNFILPTPTHHSFSGKHLTRVTI